jgi:5'-nucleotidase
VFSRALASSIVLAAAAVSASACAGASEPVASPAPGPVDAGPFGDAHAASPPVRIQILAINDFHGNLEPPAGTSGYVTVPANDPWWSEHLNTHAEVAPAGYLVEAGGVAYLAAHIKRLRASNPNTWVVSAGD